jgi:hypothetical protein
MKCFEVMVAGMIDVIFNSLIDLFCCRQRSLFDVLKAYAVHDPAVGYCQAQAPIAATLLMHLPPEQAFWVFIQINEEYVKGYFSDGLMAIKEDALATELLIKRSTPKGYQLLVCFLIIIKNNESYSSSVNLMLIQFYTPSIGI